MTGVAQNVGFVPGAGGDSNDSSQSSDAEVKKCIVKFWPKEGWKGEYGFDWFRTEKDAFREDVDNNGKKAASYYDCIGKYIGAELDELVMDYYKDDDRVVKRNEVIKKQDDKLFPVVAKDSHFGTYYLFNSKLQIPVVRDGDSFHYYYYVPNKAKEKSVSFYYTYKKKKKELTYLFKIDYEDEKVKHLHIYDELDRFIVTFGPEDKNAITTSPQYKDYNFDKNLIDRIYAHENMIEPALEQDYKHFSRVSVKPGSYKKLELFLKRGDDEVTQCLEFENLKLYHFKEIVKKKSSEPKVTISGVGYEKAEKKAKSAGVDVALLDPECPFGTVANTEELTKATVTILNAVSKKGDLDVEKETVNGEEIVHAVWEGTDEKDLIRPYWKDYFDGRGFQFLFANDQDKEMQYYFFPYLSLIEFSSKDKRRGLKSEAELQVTIEGEYEKIRFESSHKNLKVSPEKLTQNGTIKVKIDGSVRTQDSTEGFVEHTIKAFSEEEVLVGQLNVVVFDMPNPLDLDFIHINLAGRKMDIDTFAVTRYQYQQPQNTSSNAWSLKDEHFIELLGQCGVIIRNMDDDYQYGMESEYGLVGTPEGGDQEIQNDVSAEEIDIVTGTTSYGDISYMYLDDEFSIPMFERFTNTCAAKNEGEKAFISDQISKEKRPTLPAYLDQRVVAYYNELLEHMRVYLIDRHLRTDDGFNYFDGYVQPTQKESALIFQKSIEVNDHKKANAVAHELFKSLDLGNRFLNQNQYTFKAGCTTNIMDLSDVRYSLSYDQWIDAYYGYISLMKHIWFKEDYTMAMIEEHKTPK